MQRRTLICQLTCGFALEPDSILNIRLFPTNDLEMAHQVSCAVIDRIHIEQLEIHARVGVPDSERAHPQRLTVNVTFWPNTSAHSDNIADTVSYSEVAASLKEFIGQHDYRLIETLAEEMAGHLLSRFPLRKVAIEVRKFVLADADHVSVTAIREQ